MSNQLENPQAHAFASGRDCQFRRSGALPLAAEHHHRVARRGQARLLLGFAESSRTRRECVHQVLYPPRLAILAFLAVLAPLAILEKPEQLEELERLERSPRDCKNRPTSFAERGAIPAERHRRCHRVNEVLQSPLQIQGPSNTKKANRLFL